MGLFNNGEFILHSGSTSRFKIDCDHLSEEDLAALAAMIAPKLKPFQKVIGIPTGGLRFADYLKQYETNNEEDGWLIADDVLSTGSSFVEFRKMYFSEEPFNKARGVVIFARGPCPEWVQPIFKLCEA